MSTEQQPIHIATHATNVHVHLYNHLPDSTEQAGNPTAPPSPYRMSYPSHQPRPTHPLPTTANDESAPNQTTEAHPQATRQLHAQAFMQMINMLNRRHERPNSEATTEHGGRQHPVSIVPLLSTTTARTVPTTTATAQPQPRSSPTPTRTTLRSLLQTPQQQQQPVLPNTNIRRVLDNIRQESNEDGYMVSFELGTVSRSIGVSLQELAEHTTIGLYKDLEDGDDMVEREEGHVDDGVNISIDIPEGTEDADATDTCSICQERLRPFSIIRQIDRCNHYFHQSCIEKWLGEHTTCPLCMQQISSADDENSHTGEQAPVATQSEDEQLSLQERIMNRVAVELGI